MLNGSLQVIADSGYQGLSKIHSTSKVPKKGSKDGNLSKSEKLYNKAIGKARVVNENVIGVLKRFKIRV